MLIWIPLCQKKKKKKFLGVNIDYQENITFQKSGITYHILNQKHKIQQKGRRSE